MTQEKKRNPYSDVFSSRDLVEHISEYKENVANFEEGGKKFAEYLDLDDGAEAELRFLELAPLKFWQHRVFDPGGKKGKGGIRVFSCTRTDECPLCRAGDKPQFKVAWQVVHVDALDKNGNVVPRVKLFVRGIKFAEYYAKKIEKYNPTERNVVLERIGGGQSTQYTFSEWKEKSPAIYNKDECVDLEDYFGLDDAKFMDMVRIGDAFQVASPSSSDGYKGPKKGTKSRHEVEESDDLAF